MYYDPEIDHIQGNDNLIGLDIAMYVLPYLPGLAHKLYSAAVQDMGLYDADYDARARAPGIASGLDQSLMALFLAVEFGEFEVQSRLRGVLEVLAEGRSFGDGDFGFFYHLNESWPRGQLSALLMASDVGAVGSWQRLFNNKNFRGRFIAPAVVGVEFPKLGVSRAWNNPPSSVGRGKLIVSTYAATPSLRGQATSFQIVRVPAAADRMVMIECDGKVHKDWTYLDGGSVEIQTTAAEHTFVIQTGYFGPTGVEVTTGAAVARSRF